MQFFLGLLVAAPLWTASMLWTQEDRVAINRPPSPKAPAITVERGDDFRNPEEVKIRSLPKGHGGKRLAVEEPFIARDGQFLFFNSNQQEGEKDLHYAKLINHRWVYQGEMGPNINTPSKVEGNPTMDSEHAFYYIDIKNAHGASRGTFSTATGELVGVRPFEEIPPNKVMSTKNQIRVNIGVEVSADGKTMFFSQAVFEFQNGTVGDLIASDIHFLRKKGQKFKFDAIESKRVMRNINSHELDYAAGISRDGLEIFFTRFEVADYANRKLESKIMRATRSTVNKPFGKPEVVEA